MCVLLRFARFLWCWVRVLQYRSSSFKISFPALCLCFPLLSRSCCAARCVSQPHFILTALRIVPTISGHFPPARPLLLLYRQLLAIPGRHWPPLGACVCVCVAVEIPLAVGALCALAIAGSDRSAVRRQSGAGRSGELSVPDGSEGVSYTVSQGRSVLCR